MEKNGTIFETSYSIGKSYLSFQAPEPLNDNLACLSQVRLKRSADNVPLRS